MAKKTTTIRIEHAVHRRAAQRVALLGFGSFSQYVETLLRVDHDQNLVLTVVRDDKGAHYSAKSTPDSSSIPIKKKNGSSKQTRER